MEVFDAYTLHVRFHLLVQVGRTNDNVRFDKFHHLIYLVLASNESTQALNHLDAVHFGHLEVTKQQVNWATLHLHPCILKH